jgi:hypothetical protein
MRYFLFFPLVFSISAALAQEVPLTFQVDMNNEEVSENGIHVAGTFQVAAGYPSNWDPGTIELNDPEEKIESTASLIF